MVKTCGHFMNIWHAVRRDCVWADMCQVQAMYHLRTTVFGGMCARFKQCTISELLCLGWCVPGSSNVPSQKYCVRGDVCQVQAMYHLRTVFGLMCARFKQCTISELCLGWYVPGSSNVPFQNCVWGDMCQVQAAMYHLRTVFGVICAWFATAILTFNMFTRKLITNCGQRSVLFWSSILNRHMCWNDVAYVVMLNCVYILYINVPTCICVSPFISLE